MKAAENDWRRNAACTSPNTELSFPVGSAGPALAQLEQARQICRSCPVRLSCLEWAIDVGADDRMWGGVSEQERQSLRRRRRSGRYKATDLHGRGCPNLAGSLASAHLERHPERGARTRRSLEPQGCLRTASRQLDRANRHRANQIRCPGPESQLAKMRTAMTPESTRDGRMPVHGGVRGLARATVRGVGSRSDRSWR
jgi:WhiB family redox-sensing transcriptional regulator